MMYQYLLNIDCRHSRCNYLAIGIVQLLVEQRHIVDCIKICGGNTTHTIPWHVLTAAVESGNPETFPV